MSMVALTNHYPETGEADGSDLEAGQVLAATLIQSPPYAVADDKRWDENARLIAQMRNNLPELIRVARIGMNTERQQDAIAVVRDAPIPL